MPKDPMTSPTPNPRDTDIHRRSPLPVDTEVTAADMEDEEADPVVDTGPGIADGPNPRPLP